MARRRVFEDLAKINANITQEQDRRLREIATAEGHGSVSVVLRRILNESFCLPGNVTERSTQDRVA